MRCLLAVVVLSTFVTAAGSAIAAGRPNVVLIMTDNHGAWTLGCYGNRDIRTPHIDRLAAEGTLFTRAFASNPVCSPTRATCLTGLIPSQHGVHSFLAGGRLQTGPDARCTLDGFTSLPEVLRDEGYNCGLVGKWHLGGNMSPQEGLDDYWITMPHGGTSTFYGAQVIENGEIRTEPKYLTDLWTENAVNFIAERSENKDQPFFLFLAYNGPYALSRLLLRDGQNRNATYYADKPLRSFPRETPHPWQLNNLDFINNPVSIRRVATEVSGVDDGVGAVMSSLKEYGLDDNTIVIFIADQGWVGGHGGFFGMGDHTRPLTARDGMMRIPLIWRHPHKIVAGKRSDQMIANYDVMPTLLGHLGIGDKMPATPRSPGVDHSIALTAVGETISKPIFYEFENLRCVRSETAKYIHRHPNGPHELYDLVADPDEQNNLVKVPVARELLASMKRQLNDFFAQYAEPKYDMWNGGTSQVRIHDGIDEELAQLVSVEPPAPPAEYAPSEIQVPDGYTVELAAAPPLITHPTMGCLDDQGNLYVCNNAGVNLSNKELEEQLPNAIHRLVDTDADGRFDRSTVFADKMTFPMGGAWHEGSLYVASPPNIWKLTDTDNDGVADERIAIVEKFGFTGNAASIHGCVSGADGRMYWCDGFHGHEFKDDQGKVISQRQGSYIFSCLPDGSDVQILAGGGMDNPVEVDLTNSGDVLGTVNILYTRPRVDCLVHWLHGGAYPHREKVLDELKTTGELLGPAHRFGHVAISGMTRYRSGAMNHQWTDNLFATFFNHGKVVRLEMAPNGSTWEATQHEFLSSTSRDFHPTDVIEDADGSLLVIDTGGWFYRGCPTSQFAKPELLGGIYRVRREGMTGMVDPSGKRIDWPSKTASEMMRMLNDTRFRVREEAINECVRRGKAIMPNLRAYAIRGDIRIRRNCVWALTRMAQREDTAKASMEALVPVLRDRLPTMRKLACRALGQSRFHPNVAVVLPLLKDVDPGVRREAATTLGKIADPAAVGPLIQAVDASIDRSEEHAIIFSLIEINDLASLTRVLSEPVSARNSKRVRVALIAVSQIDNAELQEQTVVAMLESESELLWRTALGVVQRHPEWSDATTSLISDWLDDENRLMKHKEIASLLIARSAAAPSIASRIGSLLSKTKSESVATFVLKSLAAVRDVGGHESWSPAIRERLMSGEAAKIGPAMDVVMALKSQAFQAELRAIGVDDQQSPWLRLRALQAAAKKNSPATDQMFALAKQALADQNASNDAMAVARALVTCRLNRLQLIELTTYLVDAPPMQLRELIKLFGNTRDEETIHAFLDSVGAASAFLTLPETELSDVIKRHPKQTLAKANVLLDRLRQHRQEKKEMLSGFLSKLKQGDARRGEDVFVGKKAKCNTCHRIRGQGQRIGPDLTTIGANRSASDLLESIVLPSASIVRDYSTFQVLTDDGKVIVGLLAKETSETVVIQQATGELVSIERDAIQQMQESAVSIMPKGLDESLTDQELADIVAYLKARR